ncbi:hypothetical protein CTRI78_v006933 [Colletotrichum trifolii]|uniref:Uncharacterized protein n=1 Tax=Colletotrichum trifolii TaxID=5466 RepID=A0A4R8RDU3_COLTR|nr:hypothetical protein CTRI78_v006933 [Colletotrichum trifolii]
MDGMNETGDGGTTAAPIRFLASPGRTEFENNLTGRSYRAVTSPRLPHNIRQNAVCQCKFAHEVPSSSGKKTGLVVNGIRLAAEDGDDDDDGGDAAAAACTLKMAYRMRYSYAWTCQRYG